MTEWLVIVRAFGGDPVRAAAILSVPGGALACMPEHAASIRMANVPSPMLEFSKVAVFADDATVAEMAEVGGQLTVQKGVIVLIAA